MFEQVFNLDHRLIKLIDIENIEDAGYMNMVDISVEEDQSFCLADGVISHNSARSSIQAARGKNKLIGSFSLRGKPLNVYDAEIKDVIANTEFANMLAVTGLQLGEKVEAEADGNWHIIEIDGKDVLVNENDFVKINGDFVKVKSLI